MLQGDKVTQRHLPGRGVEGQAAELIQRAPVGRQPHADVHFIGGIFRPIGGQLQAIGDHLHRVAYAQHVCTEARGGLAVYFNAPFNAGQGAVIFDVLESAQSLHGLANLVDPLVSGVRVYGTDLQFDRFAAAGAFFLFAELQHHAGNVRCASAHVGQNLCG